jgi:hypothetical protein
MEMDMAKLKPRYDRFELETLVACVYPEEDRALHTSKPWDGEGFRHFRDSKIVCIEHFWPKPLTTYSSPRLKPAA